MSKLRQIYQRLQQAITEPTEELSRAQRTLRWVFDFTRHCARQLGEDRATQMAAALTYRTLFSLIPLIVMGLLVFRGFVDADQAHVMLEDAVYNFFDIGQLGATVGEGSSQQEMREVITGKITEFTDRAYQLSFRSIGGVGFILLLWAALALLITVEQCFNTVFDVRRGRPWRFRIPIYWTVITLGPVLLSVSLYAAGRLMAWGETLAVLDTLVTQLSRFTALFASWLLLFVVYTLMPATRVRARAAAIGAFVAAVLWELGKWGFGLYVNRAVPYSAIYGSLGLVPLFLFWVYLNWLVVLFGLEITYTLQAMHGREFEQQAQQKRQRQTYDPRWLLPMMAEIGRRFTDGNPITPTDLSRHLGVPVASVHEMADDLEKAGLVHDVHRDDSDGLALGRPAEKIRVYDLLQVGRHPESASKMQDHPLINRIDDLLDDGLDDWTLAEAIANDPGPDDSDG
ncbi:MAG: YhjD/YihY/BrkB family envelope integrity protein [Phycisphaeraceae bacterium]|nr:YhjD/YihY/BrkB family envelope integrity protein [Phycisphaeraceae bacterium]